MGEFDMYRQAGTKPNFTDIARRYGMNRHTVAKYWKAGGQVEDARRCRPSGLDRHREVIEAKAQLPGATKRGIYEYLIDRCYAGEEPPAYNTLTKWMRRNGIECGRPPEGPEPHPRFELELARPRSPQTKGKVESSNRFLSRLAVYEGDFRGEEGLVAAIARIEARCNTEPSASTGVPPAVLFMREKEELRKVGNMGLLESMVADVSVQAVPPTMLVRCRGREFSVPRRCIGRRVKVLAMPSGQVRVEMAGETVAVHDLSAPGGPVVYDPAHYAEALAAKARYADADIEAAARANLELLGRLGEGSL